MKKIVNESKNLRLKDFVENDGVGFIPIKIAGPMTVESSGFFAFTDDKGNIDTRIINSKPDEDEAKRMPKKMEEKIKKKSKITFAISMVSIFICMVLLCTSMDWPNKNIWFCVFAMLGCLIMPVMLMPKAWTIFIFRIFGDKEMVNFSKYLAAKNAVKNAYFDLGRVPNIDELGSYSCHSTDCNYTKNGYLALLSLLMTSTWLLDGKLFVIAIIAIAIALCILELKNRLTLWQVLITSKPKKQHYEVAIKALEETVKIIDSFEIGFETFSFNPDSEDFDEEECKGCPAYDFCKENSQKK